MLSRHLFSGNNISLFFIPVLVMVVLMMGGFTSNIMAWPVENGIPICTAGYNQADPTIISDGSGGAIITWYDYRSGSYSADNYVQSIFGNGEVPLELSAFEVMEESKE